MKLGLENNNIAKPSVETIELNGANVELDDEVLSRRLTQYQATKNILDLITICGKNENIDKFLSVAVEDFAGLNISKISKEKMTAVLEANLNRLDQQISASYEGVITNIVEKIKHTFTRDSKVNAIISDAISKIQNMDKDTLENTTIGYNLVNLNTLSICMKYLSELFKIIIPQIKNVAEIQNFFTNSKTLEQSKAIEEKFRRTTAEFEKRADKYFDQINDSLIDGRVKGKTYKEAGYTKEKIIQILKAYSSFIGGRLDALRTAAKGLSNGMFKTVRPEFYTSYKVIKSAMSTYEAIDYLVYRLAKIH